MFRTLACALAALGIATAGVARADTLTYSGYSVLNGQTVHLSDSKLHINEDANAGQITLNNFGGTGGMVSAFCIDVADFLKSSGSFSIGSFLTGSFGDTVNALLSHVLPTLGSNNLASSALQVAVWKAEYGSDLVVSGNDKVTDLARQYLGYVSNNVWTADPTMHVAVLDGHGVSQSQAYLTAVPEPATVAILGVGLLGFAASRRRRRPHRPQSILVDCGPPIPLRR